MKFFRNPQAGHGSRIPASALAPHASLAARQSLGKPSRYLRGVAAGSCAVLFTALTVTMSSSAFAATVPAVTAAHPRLLLDTSTLSALRQHA
ncbi:hypothetical protein, partial [Dyella sp.]|uniref:hypothetical protein n=1 Tax=Dyella sp. TaxID=1869338 RepID=UPI002D77459E